MHRVPSAPRDRRTAHPVLSVLALAVSVGVAGLVVSTDAASSTAAPSTAAPASDDPSVAGTALQRAPATAPGTSPATPPAPAGTDDTTRPNAATGVPAEPPSNRPPGEDTRPTGGVGAGRADTLGSTRVATRGRGRLMAATLTGDVVRPAAGDPRGVGVLAVRVEAGKICLEGTVVGGDAITAMRLHRGTRGTPGPSVASFPVVGPARAAGCVRVPGALTGRILQNPENWYVQATTAAFPGGAVRGQLMW